MEKRKVISIEKDIKNKLLLSIIASVLFVVGIPVTILGATNSLWIIMAIGIAFIVFGFYGAPLLWVSYGNIRTLKRVVDAVNEENLNTNEEIAKQLQINVRQVKIYITQAIKKKYLTGFLYDGTTLTANNKEPSKRKVLENKCPNCGATMQKNNDNEWICQYCGSHFEHK